MNEYSNSMVFLRIPSTSSRTRNSFSYQKVIAKPWPPCCMGLTAGKALVVILGEAGIGKTTLIHHVINTLDAGVKTILFPHSHLHFPEMLKEMLLTLKLPLGWKPRAL